MQQPCTSMKHEINELMIIHMKNNVKYQVVTERQK